MANTINHLISAAWQLIGRPARETLQSADIASYVLTQLDIANLELIGSSKGKADYKFEVTLNAQEGNITHDAALASDYELMYQVFPDGTREPIKIVHDYEDLERENDLGRKAVLFSGADSRHYRLNFDPTNTALGYISVWLISKQVLIVVDNLHDSADIPAMFCNVVIYRAAFIALDDLLLPDVKKDYSRFVGARKSSLRVDQETLEHRWEVYRIVTPNVLVRTNFYDPISDFYSN